MKNIFKFIAMAAVAIPLLIGCGPQSKEHVDEADENFTEAGENLKDAAKDADAEVKAKVRSDWQAFNNASERSIADMEQQAAELKAKMDKADKKTKANISRDLAKLELKLSEQKAKLKQKNAEFENDLNNYNDVIAAQNESFKKEFNHDMSGLSTAFNDLFRENVK